MERAVQGPRVQAELGETLVTATGFEAASLEVPFATAILDARRMREHAVRSLPEALIDTPGFLIQATSSGQGSPYVRGWTGFRNLLLVDGIRLNNSVFRDGPNQYWNTVDAFSLDRLEVVKGPGSVLYGTDAIGATVGAFTRDPWTHLPPPGGGVAGGKLSYRIASAEESHVGRGEFGLALDPNTALGVGLSGKHFGDFQAGRELGTQPSTGYDEWDLDLKLEHWLGASQWLALGHQRVEQNDVPRTHSTIFAESWEGTTVGTDLRRDLDQERMLTYAQLHATELEGALESYSLSLSWQAQDEQRDRVRASGARERQGFEADTLGLFGTATAPSAVGRWTFGADWYRDFVDSFSTQNPIQGPVADDATYDLVGAFVQDELALTTRLDLTLGVRAQYAAADAERVSDPLSGDRISIDEDWSALIGSLRSSLRLDEEHAALFAGISQGFRAPNLSDLTRFDSARTNEFEIPALGLEPERFLEYELGIRAEDATRAGELALFYTDIEDLIVRRPTGNTNASGEFEVTKDNAARGRVYGVEAGGSWRFHPAWTVSAQTAWLDGEADAFPTSAPTTEREPIDRIMPWQGNLGLRWDDPEWPRWVELVTRWADDADRLSTRDEADTSRIPPGGTPGYVVVNLYSGWQLTERVTLDVALENLFDADYRIHGSGQNRPGLGVIAGLSVKL